MLLIGVPYRVGVYLYSGEDPKRAFVSVLLLALLNLLDRKKNTYPVIASCFGQAFFTLIYVVITEITMQRPTYELDIVYVIFYAFHFSVITNTFVTFYFSWFFFAACSLYYMLRNAVRYGFSEVVPVFFVFPFLIILNFVYCFEHEASLRESFCKTQLVKQFKNSLHTVLEVLPEGILIKSGGTHHYSNEAMASKLNASREEFGRDCSQILARSPAKLLEDAAEETEQQEPKTMLYFVEESEKSLRTDFEL